LEWRHRVAEMTVVRSLDNAIWRDFVQSHPGSNVFQTPEMFRVFSAAKSHQPSIWATLSNRGWPLAILIPVRITMMGGMLRSLTSRSVAYGSVLCAPGPEGIHALSILLETYRREHHRSVLFTELRNLTDLSHLQPILVEHDFQYRDHLNYLIDLTGPPEDLIQRLGKRTRKNVRRALRNQHATIVEVVRREQLKPCYELLQKSYQRARVPLADFSLFDAAFDILYPMGMIRIATAVIGTSLAAVSVELAYKDILYGWYSGVDRSFARYNPHELLMWHTLHWGATQSYRVYDFGGAGYPDEEYGVRDFKAKFGGQLVCYGRNTLVLSPFRLAVSKIGYGIYRRLVARA
jgi:CelD/BcsL family acetyltransferase involved in cellulose biosynthesis